MKLGVRPVGNVEGQAGTPRVTEDVGQLLLNKKLLKNIYIYFIYSLETQRDSKGKSRLPAGEPDAGLYPRTVGSCPEPKADVQPLSHPSAPSVVSINQSVVFHDGSIRKLIHHAQEHLIRWTKGLFLATFLFLGTLGWDM